MWEQNTAYVQTSRDKLAISYSKTEMLEKLRYFTDRSVSDAEVRERFFGSKKSGKYLPGDSRSWRLSEARKKIDFLAAQQQLREISYRPFDTRYTYFSSMLLDWPREKVMQNFVRGENLTLLFPRQLASTSYNHVFLTNQIAEMCVISNKTKEQNAVFPLYLYPSEADLDQTRRVNFNQKLWKTLKKLAKDETHGEPDEIATFDYIYGVLHCPAYRETYAEFLRSDFPRIPWPSSPEEFWSVSEKGGLLRRLHLMEPDAVGETPYSFKGDGDNTVEKPHFEKGKAFINAKQYFDNVPEVAWSFFIGSYQPAQKWLKDRKGRALSFDDVKHYQKIVKILAETDRIMKTIEMDLSSDGDADE